MRYSSTIHSFFHLLSCLCSFQVFKFFISKRTLLHLLFGRQFFVGALPSEAFPFWQKEKPSAFVASAASVAFAASAASAAFPFRLERRGLKVVVLLVAGTRGKEEKEKTRFQKQRVRFSVSFSLSFYDAGRPVFQDPSMTEEGGNAGINREPEKSDSERASPQSAFSDIVLLCNTEGALK